MEAKDSQTNDKISETYLSKYGRYPQWVAPLMTPAKEEATIKPIPE